MVRKAGVSAFRCGVPPRMRKWSPPAVTLDLNGGSGFGRYAPATRMVLKSWKFGCVLDRLG
jgi:hypothetical protein